MRALDRAVPACGPHQCEERLNGTPPAGLIGQEGPRWRASARPSWRRLRRPKGTAAVTHGPRISRCRESRAPLAAARLRRGAVSTAEEEQLADMSRQGRRIIPALTIPARPPSSHRQPARHRSLSSCSRPAHIHNRSFGCDAGYDGSRRAGIPNGGSAGVLYRGPVTIGDQPTCRRRVGGEDVR